MTSDVVSTCRQQTGERLLRATTWVTIISLSEHRVGVKPSWLLAQTATVDSTVCVNVCKQRGVPFSQPVLTAPPSAGMPGARLLALLCQALWRGCMVTGLRGWLEAGPAKWLQKNADLDADWGLRLRGVVGSEKAALTHFCASC